MIWDSQPWKRELARRAADFRRRRSQKRWSEASRSAVERDAFVVAYSIRKLLDAKKLSDEAESTAIPVYEYASTGRPVDVMNWDKIDKLFDLDRPRSRDLGLRALCNQFIHSYVFMTALGDNGGLDGLFVTSDRDRNKRVFLIPIDEYIKVIDRLIVDDIVTLRAVRDTATGEMEIVSKSRTLRENTDDL